MCVFVVCVREREREKEVEERERGRWGERDLGVRERGFERARETEREIERETERERGGREIERVDWESLAILSVCRFSRLLWFL